MVDEKKPVKKVKALGSSDKIVPKYCSSVNFGVLQHNKQVVMSFTYQDPDQETPILIERVIVDFDHAEKLAETLTNLIKKVRQNDTK